MGEVIDWPIKPSNGPQDYDNLGPATPQMLEDMHWLANALKIGSVAWEHCLCAHCKRDGIQKCTDPDCDMFDGC